MQYPFLSFFAVVLHDYNAVLYSYTLFFLEELSYVHTKDFVSRVHVRFYFFTAAYFPLAGR